MASRAASEDNLRIAKYVHDCKIDEADPRKYLHSRAGRKLALLFKQPERAKCKIAAAVK